MWRYKLLSPNLDITNLLFKLNTDFNITQFLDTQVPSQKSSDLNIENANNFIA
jgi:hypothetical protein